MTDTKIEFEYSSTLSSGMEKEPILNNRYRLDYILGEGGMGRVYRAFDLELEEVIAVKVLRQAVSQNPRVKLFFKREVKLARWVTHPNVARTYDLGVVDGHVFLTMEYVDGESLQEKIRREGALALDEIQRISLSILKGLSAAHEAGVIHRDLKPANVLLCHSGRVLITDFGLAIDEEAETETRMVGTAHYISPEQARGRAVDRRSDIYSFGIMLWEMCTGRRPFTGKDLLQTVMMRMTTPPHCRKVFPHLSVQS